MDMHGLVAAHVPAVVADIIVSYTKSRFIRPFRWGICMICGISHTRSNENLCKKHATTCPICWGYLPMYRTTGRPYCGECKKRYPWLRELSMGASEDLWMRLYGDNDDISMERFESCVKMMYHRRDMIRSERDFAGGRVSEYKRIATKRLLTLDEQQDRDRYMVVAERAANEYREFFTHIMWVFPMARD